MRFVVPRGCKYLGCYQYDLCPSAPFLNGCCMTVAGRWDNRGIEIEYGLIVGTIYLFGGGYNIMQLYFLFAHPKNADINI